MAINLFALVDDTDDSIRKIPLTGTLQRELSDFLEKQKDHFIGADHEKVEFTGDYRIDDGEIYSIKDYPLPSTIIDAVKNPLNYNNILNLRDEQHKIKALFFGKISSRYNYVGFQVFDARKILKKGFTILNSGDNYKKLEDPGLTLQNNITALFENGELLFYSYFNTKKIIDLSAYYTEATDADIDEFAANTLFYVENMETLKFNADQIVRKKISLLHKNKVLENVTLKDLKKTAKEYNVEFDVKSKKVVIPNNKRALKELVRFLDEDYFTAPLSKRKCLTNSKKYLQ